MALSSASASSMAFSADGVILMILADFVWDIHGVFPLRMAGLCEQWGCSTAV